MASRVSVIPGFVALAAAAALAGCATGRQARSLSEAEAWESYAFDRYTTVTGSRTRHRVDAYGAAITADPVQTITARELQGMPGLTLAEKLSSSGL